jgi:hypothetical protein
MIQGMIVIRRKAVPIVVGYACIIAICKDDERALEIKVFACSAYRRGVGIALEERLRQMGSHAGRARDKGEKFAEKAQC